MHRLMLFFSLCALNRKSWCRPNKPKAAKRQQMLGQGRQPWVNLCHDEPALKGRQNGVLSPFQGLRFRPI